MASFYFSKIWNLVPYYETAIQRRKALEESLQSEVRGGEKIAFQLSSST